MSSINIIKIRRDELDDVPQSMECITYDGLHPKLIWRRTKTPGRGDDCCDFMLHCQKVSFIWPHR